MDYTTPDDNNQLNSLKFEEKVPDFPDIQNIPSELAAWNQWTCWDYGTSLLGPCRNPAGSPGSLQDALKRCESHHYGLGFALKPDDPFCAIRVLDSVHQDKYGKLVVSDAARELEKLASTYAEFDVNLHDMHLIGIADSVENASSGNIEVHRDTYLLPITGVPYRVSITGPAKCSQSFLAIQRDYCPILWMSRLQAMQGEEEPALTKLLDEFLSNPDWHARTDDYDVIEFMGHCWKYRILENRTLSWPKRTGTYVDRQALDLFYDMVRERRNEIAKIKPKKEKPEPKDQSQADELESIPVVDTEDERPLIYHDEADYDASVQATIQALIDSGAELWQRDGKIVSVLRVPVKSKVAKEKKVLSMRIVNVEKPHLLKVATSAAQHYTITHGKNDKTTTKRSGCPSKIIEQIEAELQLPFNPLLAITTMPTLREDGSIIATPGYDADTWLYYQPIRNYSTPIENPTLDDAKASLDVLMEPFEEFPFVETYHKSAAIASILGIMARHLIANAPLITITANARGTGKTLLFEVIAMIATGEEIPKSPFSRKDEEMDKQLLALAIEGARVVCFDNINGEFGSASLDRVLTSQYVKGRILGKNENAQINMLANFFATGNNLKYGNDTSRRSLPVAITSDMERPEERTGLKHPDLFRWVREHQPMLAMAALTILQAYILAGKPKQDIPPFGSFEEWSDLVRSAVVWVGMPDPCQGKKIAEEDSDNELDRLRMLINAWYLAYGSTPRDLKTATAEIIAHYNTQKNGGITQEQKEEEAKTEAQLEYDHRPTYRPEMIELGYALLEYDLKANGKISELNHRRFGQFMPVDTGKSRVISDKFYLTFEKDIRTRIKSYFVGVLPTKRNAIPDDDFDLFE